MAETKNCPLFSIITVSFNAQNTISQTIDSILKQTFTDYEIIIKDGLSSDDTLNNIISDDRIKVYSEKDSGIYDAMNRAIDYASGDYLLFLNCGDILFDIDVLLKTASKINEKSIYYGDFETLGNIKKQPEKLTDFYFYRNGLCHQSVFFEKSLFAKFGKYDTDLRIFADYDFIVNNFLNGTKFCHLGFSVCNYENYGFSDARQNKKLRRKELGMVRTKRFKKSKLIFYGALFFFSLCPLRAWLGGSSSPRFLRKLYIRLTNKFNR